MRFARLMSFVMFSLTPLLAVQGAWASNDWYVVSDYDDTVKISNVAGSKKDVVENVFEDDFYAGMSFLYNIWAEQNAPQVGTPIHFISASPTFLRHKIEEDLSEEAGFIDYRLTLRDWLRESDTVQFKLSHLRSGYLNDKPLMLIGDDTQHDPQIYDQFAKERPVMVTYIRRVTGSSIYSGQKSFLTAFDIAASEYLAGRMGEGQALEVGDVVLQSKSKEFLPSFVSCRGIQSSCSELASSQSLTETCVKIYQRISGLCARRIR